MKLLRALLSVALALTLAFAPALAQTILVPNLNSGPQSGGGTAGSPAVIQHVSSAANPVGIGDTGQHFTFTLPNSIGLHNGLVVALTYPHGASFTLSDNLNGTWPAATVSKDAGVGGNVTSVFVFPDSAAGQLTVSATFTAAVIPFHYDLSEVTQIATASPVNGSNGTADVAAPNLSVGSFTPTNNNANGGSLILAYFILAAGAGDNPTSWTAGSGFTLLASDIVWINNQGFPYAVEVGTQTTAAAINPSITATADTVNGYNSVAVALKAANAGTPKPSTIHIAKIIHETPPSHSSGGNYVFQFSFTGNLRLLQMGDSNNEANVSSVDDCDGITWTALAPNTGTSQMWYRPNAPSSASCTVTAHLTGVANAGSFRLYDIESAAVSPLDQVAGTSLTGVSGQTTFSHFPDFTPTVAPGLAIFAIAFGQGPALSVTSPSGSAWDTCIYPPEEQDTDLLENADGNAHIYYSTTATQNWAGTMKNQPSNTGWSIVASFH